MKKEEILSLTGFELAKKLNEAFKNKQIDLKQYKSVIEFWNNNKYPKVQTQQEQDIRQVFELDL